MAELKRRNEQKSVPNQDARPPLTAKTALPDFRSHYWYLNELVAFCRRHGLPTSGQKLDLVARIETFLRTGRVNGKSDKARDRKKSSASKVPTLIRLDTPVTENYKCDAETRAFFKSVIGNHFHFTAHVQQFRRERQRKGVPTTYGDLVNEWLAEYERRKDPDYKSKIARSWEYNQFVRDFTSDKSHNAGKGISEAAKAWNLIRKHKGPRSYAEYVRVYT